MRKKIVFIIVDGLADLPIDEKTPLSAAKKPNIDWLAANGSTGELTLVPKNFWTAQQHASVSHTANIALLGYNIKRFPLKRGPLEAVGTDIPYKEGNLALRCNFATVDKDLKVLDRRAGRRSYGLSELARYINQHVDVGVPFTFMRTFEHRAVLIIKMNLSDELTGNDPFAAGEKIKKITGLSADGMLAAKLVQNFVDQAHEVIEYHPINSERIDEGLPPANYILVREAGNKLLDLLPHFSKKWKSKPVAVCEPGAVRATCMLAGFDSVPVPELTFEETLNFIFENIEDLLADYNFVYAHVKGPIDEAGHDGNFKAKMKAIEAVDRKMETFKNFDGVVVLTTDHITSTAERKHMPGSVPVLVYGRGKDKVKTFDEFSVKKGKLKNYSGTKLLKFIFGK